MSDTSAFGFGKFVPGFDFLQNLSQTASKASPAAGIPGMSNWVAPTLSIEDIDKRIQELKAVQFWLEQNGTALKATIQALEVQKMTLTTLQGMNVSMADLAKAFTVKPPEAAAPAPAAQPAPAPEAEAKAAPETESEAAAAAKPKSANRAKAGAAKPAVDPMAWWGSLTQQFQNIASAAMKDVAAEAMKAQAAAKASSKASTQAAAPSPAKAAGPAARPATAKTAGRKTASNQPARKAPARKRPAA
jgi:hypothetical protein